MHSSLVWLWRARLTWRATFVVSAAACVAFLGSAGLPGILGAGALIVALVGWVFLVARMADNEVRHVAAVAMSAGRPLPLRRMRRLLFPWPARAALLVAVLTSTLIAVGTLDTDGAVALTFGLALASAWGIERAVIAFRGRRTRGLA